MNKIVAHAGSAKVITSDAQNHKPTQIAADVRVTKQSSSQAISPLHGLDGARRSK